MLVEAYKRGLKLEELLKIEDSPKTREYVDNLKFSDELIKRIKSVDKEIKILIFAEFWCPDCMINTPVIHEMKKINSNISYSILKREGHQKLMRKLLDTSITKIPTFIVMNQKYEVLGTFIEKPNSIKEIEKSNNQVEIIVAKKNYRKGMYMEETAIEILNMILGEENER